MAGAFICLVLSAITLIAFIVKWVGGTFDWGMLAMATALYAVCDVTNLRARISESAKITLDAFKRAHKE